MATGLVIFLRINLPNFVQCGWWLRSSPSRRETAPMLMMESPDQGIVVENRQKRCSYGHLSLAASLARCALDCCITLRCTVTKLLAEWTGQWNLWSGMDYVGAVSWAVIGHTCPANYLGLGQVFENTYFMFFPDFKKTSIFTFFEMTCQKVISWKQISSGNIGQCQILTAVKMNIKYFSIF